MLEQTRGIVLRSTRFSETSLILRVYTEKFGMRSYIIGGVRSPNSRQQAACFQTLSMLHLHVYHRSGKPLNRIKEVNLYYRYRFLQEQPLRSALGLFMAEVFARSVKEEEANTALYRFLEQQLQHLDTAPELPASVLLSFLIELAARLGFRPAGQFSEHTPIFNLQEGRFEALPAPHHPVISPPLSAALSDLMHQNRLPLAAPQRYELLQHLLEYFRLHIPDFRSPRSLEVLRAVFKTQPT